MSEQSALIAKVVVLAAYACLVVVIGIIGARKMKSFNDFLLGGGKVGPWMSAFSYGTAYFSAVLFIGVAAKVGWNFGLSGLWISLGNTLVGVVCVWYFIARKVKNYAVAHNVSTMPELLEHRYSSKFLKIFTAACIFVFFVPYTAAVFMGLSYLFETTFGLNYALMLTIMVIFTGVYLVLGGYRSMAIVDVIFGVTMILGVIVLFYTTLSSAGGMGKVVDKLSAIDTDLSSVFGGDIWSLLAFTGLLSIAPVAMPQLVQKFYAIRDERSIRIGMFASAFFAIIVTGVAYFTGALTRLFVTIDGNPDAFDKAGTPIFDRLMPELLNTAIPQVLSIVILLLILSASMSTLAALVLISSSTVTKDMYQGVFRSDAPDKTLTRLVRVSSVVFLLLAMGLALWRPAVIMTILTISWAAIAAVFLGPFIWALYSRRVNAAGAITGSVCALIVVIVLAVVFGKAYIPKASCIAMAVSVALPPLVSFIVPDKRAMASIPPSE
ncbi:MAG: sodium/solute symporter [Planctomycetota bacterium]|nr:sodium/solute symporter [Planctomycetota bacterium]